VIREQLLGIFGLYEAVRARVTIGAVDMVDGAVRVHTTGEVSGRLPIVRRWVTFLWWEREPEVARREGSVWRLFGFHEQPAAGGGSALDRGVLSAPARLYPIVPRSPGLILLLHSRRDPQRRTRAGDGENGKRNGPHRCERVHGSIPRIPTQPRTETPIPPRPSWPSILGATEPRAVWPGRGHAMRRGEIPLAGRSRGRAARRPSPGG
jgi:hypothetical protein